MRCSSSGCSTPLRTLAGSRRTSRSRRTASSRRDVWVVDPIDGARACAARRSGLDDCGRHCQGRSVRRPGSSMPLSPTRCSRRPRATPATLNARPIRVGDRSGLAGALVGGPRGPLEKLQGAGRWRIGAPDSLARAAHPGPCRRAGGLDAAIAGRATPCRIGISRPFTRDPAGRRRPASATPDGTPPRYNRRSTAHSVAFAAAGPRLAGPLAALLWRRRS
jgi:hypothetical protein